MLMIYGSVFILLATREYLYSPYFQYSVVLFPMLFAATPRGLENLVTGRFARALALDARRLFAALGGGMLVCALLTLANYGVLWPNDAFRGGFDRFRREHDAARQKRYRFIQEIQQLNRGNLFLAVRGLCDSPPRINLGQKCARNAHISGLVERNDVAA